MKETPIMGHVHSIQTLGTLDGPGVRFVIFAQGCPLRCGCCHNPDTWDCRGGIEISAKELISRALRYREYFGQNGGITLSGGEPLMQPCFATELFKECRSRHLHTCLDTSGCILNDAVKELLSYTDRVLLDVKYSTDEDYRNYVGCPINTPLSFLHYLNQSKIPTTLRQVIIPGLNDTRKDLEFLSDLIRENKCVDHFELLPFKKICSVKYEKMGIPFRFSDIREATKEDVLHAEKELRALLSKEP